MKIRAFGLLLASGGMLLSCKQVDDQKRASDFDRKIVDPAPNPRDFAANRTNHKVLVGIIDTGVDYNHPLLADNIHFELSTTGVPVRFGVDYVGNDSWSSPYLARTARYDPTADQKLKDSEIETLEAFQTFMELTGRNPLLTRVLRPERQVSAENSQVAYHGTHVAGLAAYDRRDIGLIAYRILPIGTNQVTNQSSDGEFIGNLVQAIHQAAKDGVRVVNISLGMGSTKPEKDEVDQKANLNYAQFARYVSAVRQAIDSHPEILFVTAAGNDSGWVDGDAHQQLPCGINLPNLICTGALDSEGRPTSFTNLALSGDRQFFLFGYELLSTIPTDMCLTQNLSRFEDQLPSLLTPLKKKIYFRAASLADSSRYRESVAKALKVRADEMVQECAFQDSHHLARLSGTSMSSPLLARQAAIILAENPSISIQEVIDRLTDKSRTSFIGSYPVLKMGVEAPRWMETFNPLEEKHAKTEKQSN